MTGMGRLLDKRRPALAGPASGDFESFTPFTYEESRSEAYGRCSLLPRFPDDRSFSVLVLACPCVAVVLFLLSGFDVC